MSAVSPAAWRIELVRRKLRDPGLAAEKHGQPCCHRQRLKFPAAMAPERYYGIAQSLYIQPPTARHQVTRIRSLKCPGQIWYHQKECQGRQ